MRQKRRMEAFGALRDGALESLPRPIFCSQAAAFTSLVACHVRVEQQSTRPESAMQQQQAAGQMGRWADG